MPLDLGPSRIKISAARDNIARFKEKTNPLSKEFYEILTIEMWTSINTRTIDLNYQPKEAISERLASIVGDALGNLRSALDFAAVRIVEPGTKVYFPVAPRKDLASHTSIAPIDAKLSGFKDLLLGEIRPEGGANEPLWDLLGKANNDNKHSDFIPTVAMVMVKNINIKQGTNTLKNCSVEGNAASPIRLVRSLSHIEYSSDCSAIVDTKFGPGTSVPNAAVVETLDRAVSMVDDALTKVGKLANG
ncbi:hypothetical protein HU230_0011680 [Bradyrhizobium quebecense]|uniref:Uncharacterized protein n=1 Tax=Bradyrhizobium quebecense TaxID=2748629 RepID=A0A974AGX0_9BRAD|nr:hypothetical protein [Bradyrhizobium quebecense]UGA46654.1 hypothetical protein HU230_0011680 [Bradyrhizobium quebecense]